MVKQATGGDPEIQTRTFQGRGVTPRPARQINPTGLRACGAHFAHTLHYFGRETAVAAYHSYSGSKDPQKAISSGIENAGELFDAIEEIFQSLPESLESDELYNVEEILKGILDLVIQQRNKAEAAKSAYEVRVHLSRHSFLLNALRGAIIAEAGASARNQNQ